MVSAYGLRDRLVIITTTTRHHKTVIATIANTTSAASIAAANNAFHPRHCGRRGHAAVSGRCWPRPLRSCIIRISREPPIPLDYFESRHGRRTRFATLLRHRHLVRLIALPPELLASRIRVSADPAVTGKLACHSTLCAFYFAAAAVAPVERVLYLDADIIVKADVHALFSFTSLLPPPYALAAVRGREAHFRYSRYAKKCAALFAARHNGRETLNVSAQTFNAGVALIDLRRCARPT